MMNHPIASERSYEVLQARLLRGDLKTPALDSTNQRLWNVPSMLVQREVFRASREEAEESRS